MIRRRTGRALAWLLAEFPVLGLPVLGLPVLGLPVLGLPACSLVNQDPPNEPPVVEVSRLDTARVARGGRVQLTVSASDEDDDPLQFAWGAGGAGSFTDSTAGTTFWIAPTQIFGASELFLLSVRIIDSQPDTEDPVETFLIEVVQRPPALTAPGDTTVSFAAEQIDFTARAEDPDGDALTFQWLLLAPADPDQLLLTPAQTEGTVSTASLTALAPATARLSVAVTDGADTATARWQVAIEVPQVPPGGTVALERPVAGDGTEAFEIDVYEYPNQAGVEPLRVTSWAQAEARCAEAGKRLCTAGEWQYACGAGEDEAYAATDDFARLPQFFGRRFCNVEGAVGDTALTPSGHFPNCRSAAGVYDLTGNAREWLTTPGDEGDTRHGFTLSGAGLQPRTCGTDTLWTSLEVLPAPGVGFRCCR